MPVLLNMGIRAGAELEKSVRVAVAALGHGAVVAVAVLMDDAEIVPAVLRKPGGIAGAVLGDGAVLVAVDECIVAQTRAQDPVLLSAARRVRDRYLPPGQGGSRGQRAEANSGGENGGGENGADASGHGVLLPCLAVRRRRRHRGPDWPGATEPRRTRAFRRHSGFDGWRGQRVDSGKRRSTPKHPVHA